MFSEKFRLLSVVVRSADCPIDGQASTLSCLDILKSCDTAKHCGLHVIIFKLTFYIYLVQVFKLYNVFFFSAFFIKTCL